MSLDEKLDELIRVVRQSSDADRYLDAHGVADLLDFSYTYTRDVITKLPDFPAPLRLGDGHARWLRSDVLRWGKARQSRRSATSSIEGA